MYTETPTIFPFVTPKEFPNISKSGCISSQPLPVIADDEVLIKVSAAGINNTDINTRTAWYSKYKSNPGGSWSGAPLKFPLIQGADVCGFIVSAGSKVKKSRTAA